jgi:hypothetical protein
MRKPLLMSALLIATIVVLGSACHAQTVLDL